MAAVQASGQRAFCRWKGAGSVMAAAARRTGVATAAATAATETAVSRLAMGRLGADRNRPAGINHAERIIKRMGPWWTGPTGGRISVWPGAHSGPIPLAIIAVYTNTQATRPWAVEQGCSAIGGKSRGTPMRATRAQRGLLVCILDTAETSLGQRASKDTVAGAGCSGTRRQTLGAARRASGACRRRRMTSSTCREILRPMSRDDQLGKTAVRSETPGRASSLPTCLKAGKQTGASRLGWSGPCSSLRLRGASTQPCLAVGSAGSGRARTAAGWTVRATAGRTPKGRHTVAQTEQMDKRTADWQQWDRALLAVLRWHHPGAGQN